MPTDYWMAVKAAYHDNQGTPEHQEHVTDSERWGRPLVEYVRRAQARRVIAGRWGDTIPDTPEGLKAVVALTTATIRCHSAKRDKRVKEGWTPDGADGELADRIAADVADVAAWVPWMDAERVAGIVYRAGRYACAGRGLGRLLGLTEKERRQHRAWHLESVDGPSGAERRKKHGNEGRRQRYAAAGRPARADYLAGIAGSERQAKPWQALGISRRWYYVLKRRGGLPVVQCAPGASPDVILSHKSGDAPDALWSMSADSPAAQGADQAGCPLPPAASDSPLPVRKAELSRTPATVGVAINRCPPSLAPHDRSLPVRRAGLSQVSATVGVASCWIPSHPSGDAGPMGGPPPRPHAAVYETDAPGGIDNMRHAA
jgi:hypothetical protein